jgi:hypothetical protein
MIAEIVVFTSTILRFWYRIWVARPWQPGPFVALARVLMRTPRLVRVKTESRTVMLVSHARRSSLQPGASEAPRPEPNAMRCPKRRLEQGMCVS